MSDRAQRILILLLAIGLVGGTVAALKYARGYRPLAGLGPAGPSGPGDIGIHFQDVKVIGRKDNKRAWTLRADTVDTTRSKSRVAFQGNIRAELLEGKQVRAIVTAPQANFDVNAKVLAASGDLTCRIRPTNPRQKDDLVVRTDQVYWNVGAKTVLCPNTVTVTAPNASVTGRQLDINIATRDFTLTNFRADFAVEEGDAPSTLGEGFTQ